LRLQALELQGFKSFPEKTKLQFDRGMTVVVGPNGSGKSNISDAIRWVLGEISSKSMRGTKMEDVIFGGTDTRSPMGFAEVSLTIDNREEANRLPTDYDEITITRRYYRSGDSEYMINRKPVRLKDITEMFLNTGLGKSGYSMINQGKSTEIISQKSEERRIIFEEAAGISKYRYKKNEAERKLKEVDENMVRVSDIKDELEVRVGPLEKEAERAKKYLDYHEKKKVADVSLWLYDVDSVKVQLQQAENEYLIAQHELEMADDTLASLETQSEKLFTDSQQNKAESTRLERLIREERDARYELDTSSQVQQNEMRHLQEQIAASKQEMVVLDASLKDAQAKGETLNDALQALMEAQNTQKAQRDALQAQVEETQDAVDVQGDKIDDC
jgi:chromosome segregation protein